MIRIGKLIWSRFSHLLLRPRTGCAVVGTRSWLARRLAAAGNAFNPGVYCAAVDRSPRRILVWIDCRARGSSSQREWHERSEGGTR